MPPSALTPDQVIAALRESGGVRRAAARALGCSHRTIGRFISRYPEVRAAFDDICRAHADPALVSPGPTLPLGALRRRFTIAQVIGALRSAGGVQTVAARILGCPAPTIGYYIAHHPQVCDAYRQARQALIDSGVAVHGHNIERYTPDQVAGALRQARGVKRAAARILGCNPATVSNYIARHPEVRAAFEEARALLVDDAESQLVAAVHAGEWPAVRYTLSTLGKDRGYTTRPTPLAPADPAPVPEPDPLDAVIDIIEDIYQEKDEDPGPCFNQSP